MADLTTNINYLQPTSFRLVIDRKNYPNLEFFCQSVSHPSMTMSAAELPYQKLVSVPFPGDKLNFGELSANVILDEDMQAYDEMYNWLRRLLDTPTKNASDKIDGTVSHYADITLVVLSSHNNKTKQIRYIDCVPTELGTIQFESTVDGTSFITFPIAFRFSYFEFE